MILIKPSFEILSVPCLLDLIETAGRTCYKSESKGNTKAFVAGLIKREHESVLEHLSITVRFIIDRGVSHELVRHRLASFSQESTRYCNYKGEVTFVIPPWVNLQPAEYTIEDIAVACNESDYLWLTSCSTSESKYHQLLGEGWSPQQARTVLPNSLKTEIVMTANIREWRHIFRLRALGETGKPYPQMVEVMVPLLDELKTRIPVVFDDLGAAK